MKVILHCDSDWSQALELFRKLPAKTCVLALDGDTDIVRAKEVLGDRMCIMGDVPATLMAFGSQDDVLAYCRQLIQTVGRDGGFILSAGCTVPVNAKASNVKALADAAEQWGWYRRVT